MKYSICMGIIALGTILSSCGDPVVSDKQLTKQPDTQSKTDSTALSTEKVNAAQIAAGIRSDSLLLVETFADALKKIRTLSVKDVFTRNYNFQSQDSSETVKIEMLGGKILGGNQKYVLLRRHFLGITYLNVYKIRGKYLQNMIERELNEMTYLRDQIKDVNGDGLKDFLIWWYPASGCCRRNVCNVYLWNPATGKFTGEIEFINPTFSSREKTIRGVGYGHSGEVGLYKYRWNRFEVDTVAFIYPDPNQKGQFIKTNKPMYKPTASDGEVLKSVPKEYQSIDDYDWFIQY